MQRVLLNKIETRLQGQRTGARSRKSSDGSDRSVDLLVELRYAEAETKRLDMAAQSQERILVAEAARSWANAESMHAQTEATVQRLQAEAKFKAAETEEQLRFKAEKARERQREHEPSRIERAQSEECARFA